MALILTLLTGLLKVAGGLLTMIRENRLRDHGRQETLAEARQETLEDLARVQEVHREADRTPTDSLSERMRKYQRD